MITDDVVSSIMEETEKKMAGIDQAALRRIIEDTMSSYDVQIKEGVGRPSDLPEKIEAYLDCRGLDGLSQSTIDNYRYHLARFARFVQKRTTTITTADIRAYLAHLVETRKIKNTTLEGEKSILKSFFSWLEDEEYIKKSPARKIRPTRVEKRVRKSLTLEELELMRDACQTARERCMLELFYSSGMRLAELGSVNIDMLNWTDNSITVIGKGNKERVVYFSDKAKVYIKKYLAVRGSFEASALFIASKRPHARMGRRSIEQEIGRIAEHAGLDKHVFPHLLRHSFATQGSKSGMSLTTLQELMGHSKIETTLGYVDADHEAAAYEHRKYLNQ
jgi:integrase/recombinase XerD